MTLDQNNIAWRTGLNWKVTKENLLYVNVSQGYKGGAFPTLSEANQSQSNPVVQESLLAYEGGFKSSLFDHALQLNGAVFYRLQGQADPRGHSRPHLWRPCRLW